MLNAVIRIALPLALLLATASAAEQPVDNAIAANYPPLMIEGDEERPGYAIEVLREASKRADRRIDITFMPFKRAIFSLRSEEPVLMPALFFGKKRGEDFLWLTRIQSAKLRFATISGRVDDLDAARALTEIVVESETTADAMLTELGFDNLVRVGTVESSARMLAAGRVDTWLQDETAMLRTWRRLKISQPLQLSDVVREVPIFLVASRALPEDIAAAYREAIDSMRSDGTLDVIWMRYE